MNFKPFQQAVHAQWVQMSDSNELFEVNIDKDTLFQKYLESFDEVSNPIFKERTHHDCNTCKQFIRRVGNVVRINIDFSLTTVWDVTIPGEPEYQKVADILSEYVKSLTVKDFFTTEEKTAGIKSNKVLLDNGKTHTFNHFFTGAIPNTFYRRGKAAQVRGLKRENYEVFKRGMDELTLESAEIVCDLISQNSLYRGKEFVGQVKDFIADKTLYDKLNTQTEKDHHCWLINKKGIRNTVIGQLLIDLSEGKELEAAVKSYEKMVAPSNYKRPTALVTKGMLENAKNDLEESGYMDSLQRRFMNESDLSVNDILFKDTNKRSLGLLDDIIDSAPKNKKQQNFDKVETVPFETFIKDILPTSKSIELFVENRHQLNLMSLITAEDKSSKELFKWNNHESWTYNGEMADSGLSTRASELGGRVDGCARFTHSWNYDHRKPNQSLMDLHVFAPGTDFSFDKGNRYSKLNKHDMYPTNLYRVGWNKRTNTNLGAEQDVDFTREPLNEVPVENITFNDKSKLRYGKYYFAIHNWSLRHPTKSGFRCEIALGNEVYEYEYEKPLDNKEWVYVAVATLDKDGWSIEHLIPEKSISRDIWGIQTNKFVKVTHSMLSPNYWGENNTGNKHLFFILDKCTNPTDARGFYNEYLKPELNDIRKSLDLFASKLRVPHEQNQLSGVGFSETVSNEFIVKVKGSFERILKVKI